MLNTFCLVGKLISKNIVETTNHQKNVTATFKVDRPFVNEEGLRIQDNFPIKFRRGLAEDISENGEIGKNYAIKGRLTIEDNTVTLIAEKIAMIGE